MSASDDSENNFREQSGDLDSGTSPEESFDDVPSSPDLPKAAIRTRRKLNSDEEDEDFIPDEVPPKSKQDKSVKDTAAATSSQKKKAIRKEYASPKILRAPKSSRATMTIVPPKKSMPKKAWEKKRARKRIVHIVGRPTSMFEDPEEAAAEEEEVEPAAKAPPKKKQKKLMAEAMPKSTTSKSTKSAPKKAAAADKTKRFSREIPASSKNKTSTFREAEDEDAMSALMKLRPHLSEHNASYLVAEDMKKKEGFWFEGIESN